MSRESHLSDEDLLHIESFLNALKSNPPKEWSDEMRQYWDSATAEERAAIEHEVEVRVDEQWEALVEELWRTHPRQFQRQPPAPVLDQAVRPSVCPPPQAGFPWFWELFPIILPRSVKERVYDPCVEELKEDYLREWRRWKGWFSRRYVTFCFTVKTVTLVGRSLWAVLWDVTRGFVRKALFAALGLLLGHEVVDVLRERLAAWFGRLL